MPECLCPGSRQARHCLCSATEKFRAQAHSMWVAGGICTQTFGLLVQSSLKVLSGQRRVCSELWVLPEWSSFLLTCSELIV